MNVTVELVLAFILGVVGVITLAVNSLRGARHEGIEHGNIEQKLDDISKSVGGVDKKIDAVDKKVGALTIDLRESRERIVKVETCLEMHGLLAIPLKHNRGSEEK